MEPFKKPLLITFEGCEGAGKTEQVKLFHPWFKEVYDPNAISSREPGGILLSEKIRELILNKEYKETMTDSAELFLFGAARASFYLHAVIPAIMEGKSVVLDRSGDSTTAYQGYGRGVDIDLINSVNVHATFGRSPDLTFVIDVNAEVGLRNASKRGKLNRIDSEKLEFHEKVREGYLEIARLNPQRCVVIPYKEGVDKVYAKIRQEFAKKYLP